MFRSTVMRNIKAGCFGGIQKATIPKFVWTHWLEMSHPRA